MPISHLAYRKDIDGLRAIAVLSVIIFHLFPCSFPGGFIGVDIFFVISGFLISKIIFSELIYQNFSFKVFYAKRIRRLFPALIPLLIACLGYGYFVLLPGEFNNLAKHTAGASAFLSNWVLARETGYFDARAEHKPLLHLWSLAVEEQFYLLWPLGLWLGWKLFSKKPWIICLAIIASFFLSFAFYCYRNSDAIFYLPMARFWEITAGALVAYFHIFQKPSLQKAPAWASTFFLMGILASLIFILPTSPPYIRLIPVLSTCGLIYFDKQNLISKLLSHHLLTSIGSLSYSLYLIHWPLISFTTIVDPSLMTSLKFKWGLFIFSFLGAYPIYRWIEQPLRKNKKATAFLFLIFTATGGGGYYIYSHHIQPRPSRLFPQIESIEQALGEWDYPPKPMKQLKSENVWKVGNQKESVLFIGDSNIEQYAPRICNLVSQSAAKRSAIFVTYGGCCPIPGTQRIMTQGGTTVSGTDILTQAQEYILSPQVSHIVIGAQWLGYFTSSTEYFYVYGSKKYLLGTPEGLKYAAQSLKNMILSFLRLGKKVYLISNIPVGNEYGPQNFFKRTLLGKWTFSVHHASKALWDEKNRKVKALLAEIAYQTGVVLINPEDALCTHTFCKTYEGKYWPIYKDGRHLRPRFVRESITFLDFLFQ